MCSERNYHDSAGHYVLLSDLRLNVLSCDNGVAMFSIAAPVLFMQVGHPVIRLYSRNVLTVTSGDRKGINICGYQLREGETAVQTRHVFEQSLESKNIGKEAAKRTMSLAASLAQPVMHLVVPRVCRITKDPTQLRPMYSRQLLDVIGAKPSDSAEDLKQRFLDNLGKIGVELAEGWCIPGELIAAGGCAVVPDSGFSKRTGSMSFQLPLENLRNDLSVRRWDVNTGEMPAQ